MPAYQPDLNDVHVDKLLTNVSVGYINEKYAHKDVAPQVLVEKESDIIPQYTKDFWFRDVARALAPGDKAPRSGFEVDNTMTYRVKEYGIGKEIPDRLRANTDAPYDLDRDGAKYVSEMIQLRQEIDFATTIFTTSVWTGSSTGGDITPTNKWDDYGLSDPVVDLRAQRRAVRQKIARHANMLVMGEDVMDTLIDHPLLIDRVKYTGGDVSEDLLKRLLRIDKVIVAQSMSATTKEGLTTQTLGDLFADDALLLYLPPAVGMFQPSALYMFVQKLFSGGDRMVTRRIRDDERMIDIIEGRSAWQLKVIDANAGAFFNDLLT